MADETLNQFPAGSYGAAMPSSLDYGVDTAAMNGGAEGSIWSDTAAVVTQGIPLAAKSAYLSFKNMPADIGNWFGGNNHIETMQEYLGPDQEDAQAYYAAHHQGIDAAGLIAGSFIPGLGTTKLLQAGRIVTAIKAGFVPAEIGAVTGLLPSVRNAKVLADATATITKNVSVYSAIGADTMKAAAWGIADQALQAAAWETATIATMHANPVLNNDGLVDSLDHIMWGGITGGLFATPFSIFGSRMTLRSVQTHMDQLEKGQETVVRQGLGAFAPGDTVSQTLAQIFHDEEVLPAVTASEKAKASARAAAVRMKITQDFNKVSDNPEVSNALVDSIYRAKEQGVPFIGAGDTVGIADNLIGARSVHMINNPDYLLNDSDSFFFNVHNKATAKPSYLPESNWYSAEFDASAVRSTRFKVNPDFAGDILMAAHGDPLSEAAQYSDRLATSATQAWENGYHLWEDANGKMHMNPNAKGTVFIELPKYTQVDPALLAQYRKTGVVPPELAGIERASVVLNTKTGRVSKEVVPFIGDTAVGKFDKLTGAALPDSQIRLANQGNSLEAGDNLFNYGLDTPYQYASAPTLEISGRFAWAKLRGVRKGDVIDSTDLPMLEAAVYKLKDMDQEAVSKLNLQMKTETGELVSFPIDQNNLQNTVVALKRKILGELQAPGAPVKSAEELAQRVNAPLDWVAKQGVDGEFSSASINPAEHLGITHVRVNYNVSPAVNDADGNVLRGIQAMQYRIDQINLRTQAVAMEGLQEAGNDIIVGNKIQFGSTSADTQQTASTFLKRADADYGTLANRLQFAGKALLNKIQKVTDATLDRMTPVFNTLKNDDVASAELAALRNAHLRMGEKFKFLPLEENPQMVEQLESILGRSIKDGEGFMVPANSLKLDDAKNLYWDHKYVPNARENPKDAANWVTAEKLGQMPGGADALQNPTGLGLYTVSPKVSNFLKVQQEINDQRLVMTNKFFHAVGNDRTLATGNIYFPPADSRNYPYIAFVRQKPGLGGGTQSTSAVMGRSADELQQKIALIRDNHPELEVHEYGKSKEYFKARGDYDYNMNLTDNDVNVMLQKSGVLVDHMPDMRGSTTLSDYLTWNKNQIQRVYRNYAELGNSQLFEELNTMGKQWEWLAKSKLGVSNEAQSAMSAENPYQMLKYQALGINPRVGYTLWNDAQDKVESLFTTAFNKSRQAFGDASKGLIDFEQANKITKSFGLGNPYGETLTSLRAYQLASALPHTPALENLVRVANSIQTALAIRLDFMQGVINTISTPILMWPEALDAAKKVGVTALPDGSGVNVLTLSKLMGKSIQNWHSAEVGNVAFKQALFDKGLLNMNPTKYFDMMNDLTLRGGESVSKLTEMATNATNKAANLIGTNFSENFGRYMAADVAKQIFEAAGQSGEELWSNINTFVSRVHGTSVAAQRPIAFQGPVGAAIGLFQTYQFNFLQNVFRYVGEGNYKALALLGGLQSTLYGMQGMPGFQFINQTIIGNAMNNPAHSDIYSGTKSFMGSHLGDLVLYGTVSAATGAGLYTRGDVNPRSMTVLPVNPLDIPTVATGIRALSNVADMAAKLHDGGAFWDTFTQGLEHNAMSRPLAGLGQILQGFSTTSQGSLISANQAATGGALDMFSIANGMRLAGARPLDEAVIMDAAFRRTAYQAADTARMATLGAAVKDSLRKGEVPSDEQLNTFVSRYAAAGGIPANFGKSMIDWSKDANTSVANEIYRKISTPAIRNQQLVMGGKRLPDYAMAPIGGTGVASTAAATPASTQVAPAGTMTANQ